MLKYFIFGIWPAFYILNKLKNKYNSKINRNIVSFSHSVGCTLIASIPTYFNIISCKNMILPLYYFSTSYFVWDSTYIFLKRYWNEYMFIYHHFVCLLALNELYYGINTELLFRIFYYGEASNFFNYIVYHMIKKNYNKKYLLITKSLQVSWFSYYRIYLFTELLYNNVHLIENKFLAYNLVVMYGLGLFWGIKQFLALINDIKKRIK